LQAHKGVRRKSDVPYIMHPLSVALIVSKEMGLGSTSIASALLHDVVEDTDYTVEDIENVFGDKIALIVDGLTKISGGLFSQVVSQQAENMRKLLLTMSDDIRVILVKIADRLHNMRTLDSLLPAKQYKIAGETMFLYAPLAHRLGLFSIKSELEDLSFKYEHPNEYSLIQRKLQETVSNRKIVYTHFAEPIKKQLDAFGFKYKMHQRVKSVYSIWKKMKNKNIDFEDIYDIFAVRIVFDPKPDIDVKKQCWDIYSIITDIYKIRPERIRDWVSHPKANGYQALHLTVMGPDGQWIEVQIRSKKMDDIAEKGFAAHWKYKEHDIQEQTELDLWLAKIQDVLEAPSGNAMDFLDTIRLNLYASEIFVFTPKGETRTLPQNATALDFAYEIHTNIGDHCIGAKVNHKLVPISYRLSSGDQIEILTSKNHWPKEEWLSFVTTAKAKTKITASLRKQRKENIKKGEAIFEEAMSKVELEEDVAVNLVDKITAYYGFTKKEDFYYALATQQISVPENIKSLLKNKSDNFFMRYMKKAFSSGSGGKAETDCNIEEVLKTDLSKIDRKKTYKLCEEDFNNKSFVTAPCCQVIPGDDVVGFIRDDGRLEIHNPSCPEALSLSSSQGDRIISCYWDNKTATFPAALEIKGIDRMGMVNEISQAITHDMSVNMKKLVIESKDEFFEGTIEVFVHNAKNLQQLANRLQKIKGIKQVKRIE
jgi:(p)ppGpp synthetase, RelA/SpoT family